MAKAKPGLDEMVDRVIDNPAYDMFGGYHPPPVFAAANPQPQEMGPPPPLPSPAPAGGVKTNKQKGGGGLAGSFSARAQRAERIPVP